MRFGRARGQGIALQNVGGETPTFLRVFPGPGTLQTCTPKNPARLHAGTQEKVFAGNRSRDLVGAHRTSDRPGGRPIVSSLSCEKWHFPGSREGDGHANQGSGHLQPGVRSEPKLVYIWGLHGPDRRQNPSKNVEGEALHLFQGVRRPIGPV